MHLRKRSRYIHVSLDTRIGEEQEYPLSDTLADHRPSEARMNLPGTVSGNWRWRYKANSLTTEIREKLLALTLLYDR